MRIKAREGDIIETFDGVFFDVKGLVHPPNKVVAFIRFVPDRDGDRRHNNIMYRKVYALPDRYALLRERFPRYLVYDPIFDAQLCEVPLRDIRRHYVPVKRLQSLRHKNTLDEVESQALQFMELLKEHANVSWSHLGISGSILIKLHTSASDIDPIVYGVRNCYRVHSALESLLQDEESQVRPYNLRGLKALFGFRSKDTAISFENFVRTESRKVLQGKFMNRDYFIRFVKDWREIEDKYGMVSYKSRGYAKIRAKVIDDSEAIFTPCCYKVDDVEVLEGTHIEEPIKEIVSFRGRFCEQARRNETIIAQGKIELVQREDAAGYYRLLLGNRRADYMILA